MTHNGELSREQLMWTAVLGSPSGAVLAAGTAAELGGLKGFAETAVTDDSCAKPSPMPLLASNRDLCCEVHGIPHLGVQQWDADVMRQNEIVIAGPRLLVFTSFAVRYLQRLVGDQMMRFVRGTSRAA